VRNFEKKNLREFSFFFIFFLQEIFLEQKREREI
jgi:hypothetical protein